MKLTKKESTAIKALQSLAETWPETLLLGSNDETGFTQVWKRASACSHNSVADIKIKNMDADV